MTAAKEQKNQKRSTAMPWDAKSTAQGMPSQSLPAKPLPAPRAGTDIEKALLATLKSDPTRQLAYVREHVSVATLRRFFKRTPMGPDLLARFVHICADLVEEDTQQAADLICALAGVPSAKTDA